MLEKRNGEDASKTMRTDRFFAVGSQWYFSTREGSSIGPFVDRGGAAQGLKDFVDFLTLADATLTSSFVTSISPEAPRPHIANSD